MNWEYAGYYQSYNGFIHLWMSDQRVQAVFITKSKTYWYVNRQWVDRPPKGFDGVVSRDFMRAVSDDHNSLGFRYSNSIFGK